MQFIQIKIIFRLYVLVVLLHVKKFLCTEVQVLNIYNFVKKKIVFSEKKSNLQINVVKFVDEK